ncbi:hypothetical protein ABZ705_04050 [Streptomyces sp. NPDC006984]|uniref:hypothetical protein n=1 Tax=Streptomyces sp. NPDC006984 TaxID=3155463 RepID=UPI00340DB10F
MSTDRSQGGRGRAAAWGRGAAGAVAVVLLAGCQSLAGGAGATEPLAPETARPSSAPPEELFPDRPTLKEPFRGSPAVRWADGAEGIRAPEAKAVGGMTEKQVAHALSSAREFLVLANTDPATLRGERPWKALALLDPRQKDGHGRLVEALAKPTEKNDPTYAFSRFDPEHVRLAGDTVKARGRMTFEKGDTSGQVLVHADYTFVYPVVRAAAGSTEVARTVVRREMTFALYDPAKFVATAGRLNVISWMSDVGNDDCDKKEFGYYRPQFDSELLVDPGAGASGPEVDPYDRSGSLDGRGDECGTVTRT